MNRILGRERLREAAFFLCLSLCLAGRGLAQSYDHPLFTSPPVRTTAPAYDAEHLDLALRLDLRRERLHGEAEYRLRLTVETPDTLIFFARGLVLDSLLALEGDTLRRPLPSSRTGDTLRVGLAPLADTTEGRRPGRGDRLRLRFVYTAAPSGGLRMTDEAAWTPPLPERLRDWLPEPAAVGDVFTSTLAIDAPTPLLVFASGVAVDEREAPERGVTFVYRQDAPLPAYALGFAAGPYERIPAGAAQAAGTRLDLAYAVPQERRAEAEATFASTAEAAAFLSNRLALPFPWPVYVQATVGGRPPAGVLPLAGLALRSELSLVDARTARLQDPAPEVVRHLARQWFGGLVPVAHWTDAWLAEGLANYLAAAFLEERDGLDAAARHLHDLARTYLAEARQYRRPLVWDQWSDPLQMYDVHAGAKGAWVFHLLRREVGDDAFWRGLRRFVRDRRHQPSDTEDLRRAFESVADARLDEFFDRWVYAAGHPVLDVAYETTPGDGALRLTIRQLQEGSLVPDVFEGALEVAVHTLVGEERLRVRLEAREQTVEVPLDMPLRFIVVDPDQAWLAETRLAQPATAWVAQLRYAPSAVARLQAAEALVAFRDDPALLIGLRNALAQEADPAVRAAVVRTTGTLAPSDAVFRVLASAYEDEAPAVREAAVEALGAFRTTPEAAALARRAAETDTASPVQAAAVRALARLGTEDAVDIIRSALVTPSHGEVIRRAALRSLPLVEVPAREALETARTYAGAAWPLDVRLAAIGYLQTLAPDHRAAQDALVGLLDDAEPALRLAAAEALGAAGDARLLPALRRRLDGEKDASLREALRRAVERIERRAR